MTCLLGRIAIDLHSFCLMDYWTILLWNKFLASSSFVFRMHLFLDSGLGHLFFSVSYVLWPNCDFRRGSTLAEFLTDGDSLGDLQKSVEELQEYDPEAVELCRTMATRYSKQLFEIYKKKEDPLFP